MRFSTLIDDAQSFTDLTQAATSATRFSQNDRITLKILPECIYFVCSTPVHEGYFMEIRILEKEIFSQYRMEGTSKEKNYIVMNLHGAEFERIVIPSEERLRLKLIKRNQQPMLHAELSNTFVKHIPINLCKSSEVPDYLTPVVNAPVVGLLIKQLHLIKNFVGNLALRNFETLEMQLLPQGELRAKAENNDGVIYFLTVREAYILDEIENAEDSDVFRLNVLHLQKFFECLPKEANRFTIRVSDLNQIVISVKHSNLEYILYMSSMIEASQS